MKNQFAQQLWHIVVQTATYQVTKMSGEESLEATVIKLRQASETSVLYDTSL